MHPCVQSTDFYRIYSNLTSYHTCTPLMLWNVTSVMITVTAPEVRWPEACNNVTTIEYTCYSKRRVYAFRWTIGFIASSSSSCTVIEEHFCLVTMIPRFSSRKCCHTSRDVDHSNVFFSYIRRVQHDRIIQPGQWKWSSVLSERDGVAIVRIQGFNRENDLKTRQIMRGTPITRGSSARRDPSKTA